MSTQFLFEPIHILFHYFTVLDKPDSLLVVRVSFVHQEVEEDRAEGKVSDGDRLPSNIPAAIALYPLLNGIQPLREHLEEAFFEGSFPLFIGFKVEFEVRREVVLSCVNSRIDFPCK